MVLVSLDVCKERSMLLIYPILNGIYLNHYCRHQINWADLESIPGVRFSTLSFTLSVAAVRGNCFRTICHHGRQFITTIASGVWMELGNTSTQRCVNKYALNSDVIH